MGSDEYALPIESVQEVVHYTRPRPLPRADPLVRGVIDLRGRVIPIASARAAFGLSDADQPDDAKIVVVQLEGARVGLIVDDVVEVLTVDPRTAVPPPDRAGEAAVEAVRSVLRLPDRLLVVLDAEALLDPARQAIAVSMEAFAPARDEACAIAPEPEPEPEPEAAAKPGSTHEPEPDPEPEPPPVPEPPVELKPAHEPPPAPARAAKSEDGPFCADDIATVRAVFALMEPHEEQALELFSTRLADIDPGLRLRLGLDESGQRRRFMAALRLSVRGLDQLDGLIPALSALGVTVDTRTISPADCRTAIDAFLWALQRGLGNRFDAADRRACGATAWTLLEILARADGS